MSYKYHGGTASAMIAIFAFLAFVTCAPRANNRPLVVLSFAPTVTAFYKQHR